ncbi:MAG: NAD-dependent epimerase/dehydratase family protein, partial [Bacillota bacterium]|nr:NAD-dependent epimerase/dehydratase family protein [Bacillota bacterium]
RLHQVDVASPELLSAVVAEKPDAIVHLAAQISVSASARNPEEDARVNIGGALNVLRAAHASGCNRIVYSSSAAVYGNPASLPLQEVAPMRPISPYGVSKRAAEDYFLANAAATGLTVGVLRYGNVYGPRQAVSAECGVTTIFVQKILEGQSPTIFGDGSGTRDYVYVSDVAEATVAALLIEKTFVLNISSGQEISVQALWDQLVSLSGKSIKPCYGPERLGDIYRSCLDPSLAWRELSWRSTTSLPEGLKKTLEYYTELGCTEGC